MATKAPIRIVVGEDQPIVREGIVRVLEGAGFEVVGVAGDAEDLIRKAGAHKPDVVVTDIQMPPTSTDDGLEAARRVGHRVTVGLTAGRRTGTIRRSGRSGRGSATRHHHPGRRAHARRA